MKIPGKIKEFEWKEHWESNEVTILQFTGNTDINIDVSELKNCVWLF